MNLSDKDLPIDQAAATDGTIDGVQVFPAAWQRRQRFGFLANQWLFLAPVFSIEKFNYELHKQCPLPTLDPTEPFNAKKGLSGSVRPVRLHKAHQKVPSNVREIVADLNSCEIKRQIAKGMPGRRRSQACCLERDQPWYGSLLLARK